MEDSSSSSSHSAAAAVPEATGAGLWSLPGSSSVHVSVDLLQQRVQRRVLSLFDLLHQLRVLGDQLPQVGQFLQQPREQEGVVRVVGQQVELQHLHDVLLHPLDVSHVHQARSV